MEAIDLQQVYASYIYGDSASGQHALCGVCQTGIPVFNVNNNCCSGSPALYLARQTILSGQADCVSAFGFEEMQAGTLGAVWADGGGVGLRIHERPSELDVDKGLAGRSTMPYISTSRISPMTCLR